MLTKAKVALSAAIVLGTASAVAALPLHHVVPGARHHHHPVHPGLDIHQMHKDANIHKMPHQHFHDMSHVFPQ
jgi:hypothetical protein